MSSFTSKFKSTFSLVILLFLFICAYEYGRMQPRTQLAQHKTTGQTQPRNHEDDPHAAAPQEETDSESEMFSNSNDDQNTASSVVDSLTLVIPKQNGSEFEKPPALDDDELGAPFTQVSSPTHSRLSFFSWTAKFEKIQASPPFSLSIRI